MKRADPRLVAYGVLAVLAGMLAALFMTAPVPRLLASLTAIAVGFGLVRQAFRIE